MLLTYFFQVSFSIQLHIKTYQRLEWKVNLIELVCVWLFLFVGRFIRTGRGFHRFCGTRDEELSNTLVFNMIHVIYSLWSQRKYVLMVFRYIIKFESFINLKMPLERPYPCLKLCLIGYPNFSFSSSSIYN